MQKQTAFFELLKSKIPKGDLVEKVASILNISTDSAYRRMRGQTVLSIDEFFALAQQFKLPIDRFVEKSTNALLFEYGGNLKSKEDFMKYFNQLSQSLQQIAAVPNSHIYYAAKDIPVFYQYLFPELAAFKLFIWMKTIFNFHDFKNENFNFTIINQNLISKALEVGVNYSKCTSSEIWSNETITSTLKQMEYAKIVGIISESDLETVKTKLIGLLQHVKMQAEGGSKFAVGGNPQVSGNYHLYFNELLIMNNMFSVSVMDQMHSYFTFNALNYIATNNQQFCSENKAWLEKQTANSTLISQTSKKERERFFNSMINRVEAFNC